MSFLSKIFKKKVGGTGVGNLVRGVAGIVGLGKGNGMLVGYDANGKAVYGRDAALGAQVVSTQPFTPSNQIQPLITQPKDPVDYVDKLKQVSQLISKDDSGSEAGYIPPKTRGGQLLDQLMGIFNGIATGQAKVTAQVEPTPKTNTMIYVVVGIVAFLLLRKNRKY